MLVLRNLFHIFLPIFRQENLMFNASHIRPAIVGTISPDKNSTIPIKIIVLQIT